MLRFRFTCRQSSVLCAIIEHLFNADNIPKLLISGQLRIRYICFGGISEGRYSMSVISCSVVRGSKALRKPIYLITSSLYKNENQNSPYYTHACVGVRGLQVLQVCKFRGALLFFSLGKKYFSNWEKIFFPIRPVKPTKSHKLIPGLLYLCRQKPVDQECMLWLMQPFALFLFLLLSQEFDSSE